MQSDETTRKPGEAIFALILSLASLAALWQAYGISGFEALSSPGSFPMAACMTMVISALIITVRTFRTNRTAGFSFVKDILPATTAMMVAFVILYAIALNPLGFLPTSLIFLFVSILILSRRGIVFSAIVSVFSLFCIYVIFRLVFSVLMPEGIVPEREFLAFIGNLFNGANP